MTIAIASVMTLAGIWLFGIWLGHQEDLKHRSRYEGFQKFPRCVGEFAALDGHSTSNARLSHPHRYLCIR